MISQCIQYIESTNIVTEAMTAGLSSTRTQNELRPLQACMWLGLLGLYPSTQENDFLLLLCNPTLEEGNFFLIDTIVQKCFYTKNLTRLIKIIHTQVLYINHRIFNDIHILINMQDNTIKEEKSMA